MTMAYISRIYNVDSHRKIHVEIHKSAWHKRRSPKVSQGASESVEKLSDGLPIRGNIVSRILPPVNIPPIPANRRTDLNISAHCRDSAPTAGSGQGLMPRTNRDRRTSRRKPGSVTGYLCLPLRPLCRKWGSVSHLGLWSGMGNCTPNQTATTLVQL